MYRLIADYYSADDLVVRRRVALGNWAQVTFVYNIICKFPHSCCFVNGRIEFAKYIQIFTMKKVCYLKHKSCYLSCSLSLNKLKWNLLVARMTFLIISIPSQLFLVFLCMNLLPPPPALLLKLFSFLSSTVADLNSDCFSQIMHRKRINVWVMPALVLYIHCDSITEHKLYP